MFKPTLQQRSITGKLNKLPSTQPLSQPLFLNSKQHEQHDTFLSSNYKTDNVSSATASNNETLVSLFSNVNSNISSQSPKSKHTTMTSKTDRAPVSNLSMLSELSGQLTPSMISLRSKLSSINMLPKLRRPEQSSQIYNIQQMRSVMKDVYSQK